MGIPYMHFQWAYVAMYAQTVEYNEVTFSDLSIAVPYGEKF